MYEVFQPDFVLIAPGYPQNGRQVIGGIHYVNGVKLEETEAANDPKTPVAESNIQRLIEKQTRNKSGHLSYEDIRRGHGHVRNKLERFRAEGISYVTADSVHESDLQGLALILESLPYSIILAGSAGLMSLSAQSVQSERKGARSNRSVFRPADHVCRRKHESDGEGTASRTIRRTCG